MVIFKAASPLPVKSYQCALLFKCRIQWRSMFGHQQHFIQAHQPTGNQCRGNRCYDNLMAVLMKQLYRFYATVHWKQKRSQGGY